MGCSVSVGGLDALPAAPRRVTRAQARATCLASLGAPDAPPLARAAGRALERALEAASLQALAPPGSSAAAAASAATAESVRSALGAYAAADVFEKELQGIGAKLAHHGVPLSVCAQLPSFLHAAVKEAQPSVFTPEVDAAWLQVAGDAAPLLVRAVARARPTVKPPALAECVALCKASWAALDDISEAGVQTYLHMFTADPKTLKLFIFQNVPLASMEADGRLRRHVRKTFGVVGRLLTAIPDGTADLSGFRRDVERIGASHGHKLVSAGMLDSFGAGLLNALPPLLLDKWTPETAAAWAALYAETKHAFVGGLNAWRAGAYPDAAITGCAPPEFRVPGDYAVGGGAARAAPLHGTRAGVP